MMSSVVNKCTDKVKMHVICFFTTNLNQQASERERASVDGSHQPASVLLLITAGSQSKTRTVAFCCKTVLFANVTVSPIVPSAPKCSSRHFTFHRKYVCFAVIRFHPSHRLFSCLRNHSTVSLTIPLDD